MAQAQWLRPLAQQHQAQALPLRVLRRATQNHLQERRAPIGKSNQRLLAAHRMARPLEQQLLLGALQRRTLQLALPLPVGQRPRHCSRRVGLRRETLRVRLLLAFEEQY